MGLFGLGKSETEKQISDLEKILERNPGDHDVRRKLVDLTVEETRKHANGYKDNSTKAEKNMMQILENGVIYPKTVLRYAEVYKELDDMDKIRQVGAAMYSRIQEESQKPSHRQDGKLLAWYYAFCNEFSLDPRLDVSEIPGLEKYVEAKIKADVSSSSPQEKIKAVLHTILYPPAPRTA